MNDLNCVRKMTAEKENTLTVNVSPTGQQCLCSEEPHYVQYTLIYIRTVACTNAADIHSYQHLQTTTPNTTLTIKPPPEVTLLYPCNPANGNESS
jgi:hypothetical protein